MAYIIDKNKLRQYRQELHAMHESQNAQWKIKNEAGSLPEIGKIHDAMDKFKSESWAKINAIVRNYLEEHGYYKIKFDENQMQSLRRVIGRIESVIIKEALEVANDNKLVLSDFDGTKWQWCDWYLKNTEDGTLTRKSIKSQCKGYKVRQ
jgi:hypothetical protein